jgi:hypothetical protein
MTKPDPFGPWVDGLDPAERLARLRSLRALVQVFAGPAHPMAVALARAESDSTDEAALAAWKALETMPVLQHRRILASLGTLKRLLAVLAFWHGGYLQKQIQRPRRNCRRIWGTAQNHTYRLTPWWLI